MPQHRKETAWKKSRKFGDVKGGRKRPKLADNIFNRQHNFTAPGEHEERPVFIVDNPSRDFFFPVTVEDIQELLRKLPQEHTENLTHIWLRKMSTKEYQQEGSIQGCFICGSGVNLIVLYPFPADLKMPFGTKKPTQKTLRWYAPFEPQLIQKDNSWILQWTEDQVKRYYLEGLLLHEVGHQLDSRYKRFWSPKYAGKRAEQYADNYAFYWGDAIRTAFE